jgi:hypothetical protein
VEEERREGGETSLKDGIVERECTPFKMPAWTLELMERPLLSLLALQSSRVPEVRGPAAKPRGSASATADPTAIFTYPSFHLLSDRLPIQSTTITASIRIVFS